jgi:hypothetical protein
MAKLQTSKKAPVAGEKRKLDVKSKKWDGVYKEAKLAMGIHGPSEFISESWSLVRILSVSQLGSGELYELYTKIRLQ